MAREAEWRLGGRSLEAEAAGCEAPWPHLASDHRPPHCFLVGRKRARARHARQVMTRASALEHAAPHCPPPVCTRRKRLRRRRGITPFGARRGAQAVVKDHRTEPSRLMEEPHDSAPTMVKRNPASLSQHWPEKRAAQRHRDANANPTECALCHETRPNRFGTDGVFTKVLRQRRHHCLDTHGP